MEIRLKMSPLLPTRNSQLSPLLTFFFPPINRNWSRLILISNDLVKNCLSLSSLWRTNFWFTTYPGLNNTIHTHRYKHKMFLLSLILPKCFVHWSLYAKIFENCVWLVYFLWFSPKPSIRTLFMYAYNGRSLQH